MLTEYSSEPIMFEPEDEAGEPKNDFTRVGRSTLEFSLDFSSLAALLSAEPTAGEMSDNELIVAAAKTGTFEFWDGPQEDGYNHLLNE